MGDSHLDEYDTSLPEGTPWPFSGLDINPTGKAGRPMFDDVAWFFAHPLDLEDYDDSYGAERFAARFAANDGVVLESWTERMIRSTLYPAMKEYALEVLNPGAAYPAPVPDAEGFVDELTLVLDNGTASYG